MKETIYIFSDGELVRKDNSLMFETKDGEKKYIPVENVREIFIFGEVDINKRLLEFLSQKEIMLSFFNYYGFYVGSYYPREHNNSGFAILKQAEYYLDNNKRIIIAQRFVEGAAKNGLKVLKYYNRRGKDLQEHIEKIESILPDLVNYGEIPYLMQKEAEMKKEYYKAFDEIIDSEDFKFLRRSKRPPIDRINAIISFSNSLIYTTVLREIYSTHLDPRIGYLHATNFRRFSLNLDIAEIFKPVIGDRTIFHVLNKNILSEKDFEKDLDRVYLNNKGKAKFIEALEERMSETIKLKKLDKQVSYRTLIRMEIYKLEKHIMGEEEYQPFVMEW